jgi:glycosyltransferase involved in cell wall biosynthesis
MKECGVGPYLLARRQNAKSVMFFCHPDREYPYLKYLPGMELDYTVHPERILNGKVQNIEHYSEYIDYLRAHKDEMDILCLQGPYNSYFDFIERYRALRQDGKIYMALDMSCEWAKGYPWDMESVTEFFSRLDAIATSCRKMRDVLNRDKQVNFGCWWMPNGFYGTEDAPATADARLKENVILTVGRIGTAQKNNEEMLNAFALASKDIPTWSLRLVGKVDNRFKPFMQRYFAANPQLKQRVIFTGPILDKAELYKEYARAKIFCLTSQVEGGTPNVYAEALFHGCAFLTTDIDAANDITADGTLGASYPLRDIKQLANLMREYCKKTTPHFMRQHIAKALDYGRRYYDWRLNARKWEYMIFSGPRAPER